MTKQALEIDTWPGPTPLGLEQSGVTLSCDARIGLGRLVVAELDQSHPESAIGTLVALVGCAAKYFQRDLGDMVLFPRLALVQQQGEGRQDEG